MVMFDTASMYVRGKERRRFKLRNLRRTASAILVCDTPFVTVRGRRGISHFIYFIDVRPYTPQMAVSGAPHMADGVYQMPNMVLLAGVSSSFDFRLIDIRALGGFSGVLPQPSVHHPQLSLDTQTFSSLTELRARPASKAWTQSSLTRNRCASLLQVVPIIQ